MLFIKSNADRLGAELRNRGALLLLTGLVGFICVDWRVVAAWLAVCAIIEPARTAAYRKWPHRNALIGCLANIHIAAFAAYAWIADPGAGRYLAILLVFGAMVRQTALHPVAMSLQSAPFAFVLVGAPLLSEGLSLQAGAMIGASVLFILCLLATRRDFNRLKHMVDEEAIARRVAEEDSRRKSSFVTAMTHELRTPLNAIIGYAELLIEEPEERATEAGTNDLLRLRSAAQRLMELVNGVLDLSLLDMGELGARSQRVALAPIISATVEEFAASAAARGNALSYAPSAPQDFALGDPERIRQCVCQLVGNAVGFTEQGEIAIVVRSSKHNVEIEVADTGVGIAANDLGRLFQPFVQLDAGKTRRRDGLGIGLALAQRLARCMGGDISVESRLGEGSRFTLRLPAAAGVEDCALLAA